MMSLNCHHAAHVCDESSVTTIVGLFRWARRLKSHPIFDRKRAGSAIRKCKRRSESAFAPVPIGNVDSDRVCESFMDESDASLFHVQEYVRSSQAQQPLRAVFPCHIPENCRDSSSFLSNISCHHLFCQYVRVPGSQRFPVPGSQGPRVPEIPSPRDPDDHLASGAVVPFL
jgi:hypothetical protein